ncbi:hypothetical protein GCM10027296_09760 [Chitinimonas naiadis]
MDAMLDSDVDVCFILDRKKGDESYRGVPVLTPDAFSAIGSKANFSCVVALHNHYVDMAELFGELKALGFSELLTLVQFIRRVPTVKFSSYWLDTSFDYSSAAENLTWFRDLLSDKDSKSLLDAIIQYRLHGAVNDCPVPSIHDEYVPEDLPRYHEPLRLIDCGACFGVAVEKMQSAGYELDAVAVFEPDPGNFEKLGQKRFGQAEIIRFPLGVWSSNIQLRFDAQGTMGSAIGDAGGMMIQCASIDSLLPDFKPNLIKMDVEGAELEALKGAELTLRECSPDLCISLYHLPGHLLEIPMYLAALGLDYSYHLRVHEFNTFGTVLYCRRKH